MKTELHAIKATYTTNCNRKIKDAEGERVARITEERQMEVSIQRTDDGRLFFRGAQL